MYIILSTLEPNIAQTASKFKVAYAIALSHIKIR